MCIALVSCATSSAIASRVAVRAQADPAYAFATGRDGGEDVETYVFYPGKFFPGQVRDRTLERFPFRDIALGLAPHLARRGFMPAPSLEEADLVLVVHWGVTMGYDRAAALFSFSLDTQSRIAETREVLDERLATLSDQGVPSAFDPEANALQVQLNDLGSELNADRVSALMHTHRDSGASSNATLLGIGDLLHEANKAAIVTTRHETLNAMLDEDRYFVSVMAYDRRSLIEDRILRRRWSIRLSVRAPGHNFRTAVAALAQAGGDVFGGETDGLVIRRSRPKETRVDIGEVVVIGEAARMSDDNDGSAATAPEVKPRTLPDQKRSSGGSR